MKWICALYLSGDCSRLNCKYGATCQVIKDLAQCECNFTCLDSRSSVCGSDGRTYKNICDLQKKQCTEKKYINVIKNEACGELVVDQCLINNNKNILIIIKLYLKKVQLYKKQFCNANLTLGHLFNCYRLLITNLLLKLHIKLDISTTSTYKSRTNK